ncbi:glycoside hydrolase family 43 protein [Ohtaekwangia sp.]|uniref:glycoside hydrolase family 43 protein n=1 Tax=Ohtaekwangia sp. TaxID=2066019 RepID=UPI002F92A63A
MANPIITHKYTADPTVIVVNDVVYLYTGHDNPPDGIDDYVMNEWLCFSSPDLVQWTEHPVPLRPEFFSWAKGDAYASKVIQHNNKYYWFVATTPRGHGGKAIGVAIATSPLGPFKDACGSALIDSSMISKPDSDNFDPSVLIDNGEAYIFWGKHTCFYAKLSSDLTSIEGEIKIVSLPDFEEGIHIHKHQEWYYLSYGYGYPEKVAYAMSKSIHGPWEFKGILNELAGNCITNRPAIIDFKEQSYFFYHNGGLKNGGSHRRSVCIDYLYYNDDRTIKRIVMTSEGVKSVL